MLPFETCEKLKAAGLEWAYEYGFPKDCVYYKGKLHEVDGPGADNTFRLAPWGNYVKQDYIAFAPRLDQLLAEIEKRGCTWALYAPNNDGKYGIDIGEGSLCRNNITAMDNSPEEAAAAALIWILEQGGKPNEL